MFYIYWGGGGLVGSHVLTTYAITRASIVLNSHIDAARCVAG